MTFDLVTFSMSRVLYVDLVMTNCDQSYYNIFIHSRDIHVKKRLTDACM